MIKTNMTNRAVLYALLLMMVMVVPLLAQDYELVWSDEFDGTELDLSKWEFQTGTGTSYGLPAGWGNNEKEYYRAENTTVSDGYMTITAKKENYQGNNYTSSRIRTLNKGDWKYGKIVIRAKLPIGQGIWPALWLLPTDNVYGGWAASGEIDMMEYLGHQPSKVYGTIHYGGGWPNNTSSGNSYTLAEGTFHDDFHVFTLEWKEGVMKWYVDDSLYQTKNSWWSSGGDFPAPFDERFHLLINLAVGGNWPGYPDETTEFPQELVVDYVRVYQKTVTGIHDNGEHVPAGYALRQNFPNPFNAATMISYSLEDAGKVNLSLYDVQGRKVTDLVNSIQNAGTYTVHFDATGLSSGVYIYRLEAGHFAENRKLVLVQ